MPPMNRNAARVSSEVASPLPSALTTNSAEASHITRNRPYRSATRPVISAPNAAPISATDTVSPSQSELAEYWSRIADTAPLMTALSYPNRNPPIAATDASRVTVALEAPTPSSSVQITAGSGKGTCSLTGSLFYG
jgi:hypothetical protein